MTHPVALVTGASAATVRRPRTRYVVGYGARPTLIARWLLTDRAFDRVLDRVYRPVA